MPKPTGDILRDTRTFGIAAHIDAGKTSVTDLMIYVAGKKRSVGVVHEGTTTTDSMEQEKERGITIQSAPVYFQWNGLSANLIDTPGHVDFGIEVKRALRVLDGVVMVICACAGVEPQTVTNWNHAENFELPRIIFVNKMDKVGADFLSVANDVKAEFNIEPLIVQLPIGAEATFGGVIDLFTMKALRYDRAELKDGHFVLEDIPAEMLAQATEYRAKMVERIVEGDDVLLEKFFADEASVTVDELRTQLRKDVIARRLIPMMCGSALKHKGCQPLLDAVMDFLPSPADVPPVKGLWDGAEVERAPDVDAPMSALAFKPIKAEHSTLTFVRVYSGKITAGSRVYNSTKERYERVMKLVKLMGKVEEPVEELKAGEIGAIVGMKETLTGDTLCDEKQPIVLESISFPEPVVFQAIEPKSRGDQDKMMAALVQMMVEDPSFRVRSDAETGQTIIGGQGELHLEIKVDILRRTHHVEANVFPPSVSYRETIRAAARGVGKHKKQSGGTGQYGHAEIMLEPLPVGSGYKFIDNVKNGDIPVQFIPAVDKGIQETLASGILAGYPIVDVQVTLLTGSYHDVDSNEIAFKTAGSLALKDAFAQARPVLLEPVGKMDLIVPGDYIGDVTGEINSRRGRVEAMDSVRGQTVVRALMPVAKSFGMTNAMRSKTQGKVTPSLEFSHYEEVPKSVAEEVLAEKAAEKAKK